MARTRPTSKVHTFIMTVPADSSQDLVPTKLVHYDYFLTYRGKVF